MQLRHQYNALVDLETKLAEDGINAESLPEDANDNLNWIGHHHKRWHRRGCKNKNKITNKEVEIKNFENEQDDVKCERY